MEPKTSRFSSTCPEATEARTLNWDDISGRVIFYQLEKEDGLWSTILLQLITSVVHCATPSVDDASLITVAPPKAVGNAGWFAKQHQGPKTSEQNRSRTTASSYLVEKGYFWAPES